jgi:hypothetical protein
MNIFPEWSQNREVPRGQNALAFMHEFVFFSVSEAASWPQGNQRLVIF